LGGPRRPRSTTVSGLLAIASTLLGGGLHGYTIAAINEQEHLGRARPRFADLDADRSPDAPRRQPP